MAHRLRSLEETLLLARLAQFQQEQCGARIAEDDVFLHAPGHLVAVDASACKQRITDIDRVLERFRIVAQSMPHEERLPDARIARVEPVGAHHLPLRPRDPIAAVYAPRALQPLHGAIGKFARLRVVEHGRRILEEDRDTCTAAVDVRCGRHLAALARREQHRAFDIAHGDGLPCNPRDSAANGVAERVFGRRGCGVLSQQGWRCKKREKDGGEAIVHGVFRRRED